MIMDEKDFEILKILDKNCRVSYSSIAKSLNLSLRNVSQRIDNLLNLNIIKFFSVQFYYNLLGFRHYIGSIIPNQDKMQKDFFKEIQLIPEIYRIWELLDGTLVISFFCQDVRNLEEMFNDLANIGVKIEGYSETRTHFPIDIPFSLLDWRIIYYLFKNSRASKLEVASALDVSKKTIMRRLNRMQNMKLIQFLPEINFEAITSMISAVISLETDGPSKSVYLKVKEDKTIKYWRNAGSVVPSIVLFIYGRNLTEIYNIFLKLRKCDDIKRCRLSFIVRNWENSTLIEDAILEKIQ